VLERAPTHARLDTLLVLDDHDTVWLTKGHPCTHVSHSQKDLSEQHAADKSHQIAFKHLNNKHLRCSDGHPGNPLHVPKWYQNGPF
jgi:hypothetical protein